MIIGAGLDKTGLMGRLAGTILKVAGRTEARVIPAISGTVGFISSFMQNVGAAALFLPVVSRISARTGLPMSRLLMPMGFCAILGGTITMVGSSPLILLNDLILTSNKALPAEHQMQTWSLFTVTPIGLALLSTGIAYFVLAGRFVLPGGGHETITQATNTMEYFQRLYGLDYGLFEWWCRPAARWSTRRSTTSSVAAGCALLRRRRARRRASVRVGLDRDCGDRRRHRARHSRRAGTAARLRRRQRPRTARRPADFHRALPPPRPASPRW
jgi:di/tricarboxylate transporter